ncbi:hypothetical protein KL911_002397 [Ogataea haglerorum]|uniref:uncharacterized protein n=1 Tax=Ogataea haglerorum TaxID=1937702 RepID=UPI001C893889|nr:uncharacterized protein KL911_002397 [Ogataea haglerorum]KAG7753921.1 hypothetical protein KL911_002397 [Ogataea haglerorum]
MAATPSNWNEFRSDTFTTPSPEMLATVLQASTGDSVYNEDADTLALQRHVCELTGHEAGLYCVSGTLSNQIAIRSHLNRPPHSVLCDYRSHIFVHEAAGLATLSQAMVTTVIPANGLHLTLEDIQRHYIPDNGDIHSAPTRVVSLENTLHGLVFPIDEIHRISKWCRDNNIAIHCDGARIWDAAVASGVSLAEYGELFDSISLCLSKTLGAPIGSVLVGSESLIRVANHFKKQNGGGVRQAGPLARMGSYALAHNLSKLKTAHAYAAEVGRYAEELGLVLQVPVHTNFVFLDPERNKIDPQWIRDVGQKHNVKVASFRIAFSFQNTREAVDAVKAVLKDLHTLAQQKPYTSTTGRGIY